MKESDDKNETSDDDLFAQKAKAVFDRSVEGLDGQTQSRLNQSRQAALAELAPGGGISRWSQWVPATGVAAAAVFAVVLWNAGSTVDPGIPMEAIAPAAVNDFEILLDEDSFDMLQDLEFYSWIDIDAELQLEPAEDANVG